MKRQKIFVGVSGGVDSSVTAALLKDQGHDVTGVFIRTWQPDWIPCTWRDERRDAMRVCAQLDIPFWELDLTSEYKQGVADYMIAEYRAGRTPNPDVMCNREVKFGGFLRWARMQGADYIATGHYVALSSNNNNIELLRGIDPRKDQSYFLWMLTQDDLNHVLFPLGDLTKDEVRKHAHDLGLITSQKKDSQGICFIGEIDMKAFLRRYIDEEQGEVHNTKGECIGSHPGSLFFTLGERHGFHIFPESKGSHDQPYYVVVKDQVKNILIVSQNPQEYYQNHKSIYELESVIDNNTLLKVDTCYEAQMRHRGEIFKVKLTSYSPDTKRASLDILDQDKAVASGQSIVLYQGRQCLGGGIVV